MSVENTDSERWDLCEWSDRNLVPIGGALHTLFEQCGDEVVCTECDSCSEHCEHKKPMSLG